MADDEEACWRLGSEMLLSSLHSLLPLWVLDPLLHGRAARAAAAAAAPARAATAAAAGIRPSPNVIADMRTSRFPKSPWLWATMEWSSSMRLLKVLLALLQPPLPTSCSCTTAELPTGGRRDACPWRGSSAQ